jgi:hypothetical protein
MSRQRIVHALCDRGRHVYRFEQLVAGENSITLSPSGSDVIRWSGTQSPSAMGDLGMDVSTGRPQAYISGASRNLAYVGESGGGINFDHVFGVASNEGAGGTGWTTVGSLYLDPSVYPSSGRATTFFALIASTAGRTAECRLFNVTDAAVVSSSTVSTTSGQVTRQTAFVTLPTSGKVYDVQIRLTAADAEDRAICSGAGVTVSWT